MLPTLLSLIQSKKASDTDSMKTVMRRQTCMIILWRVLKWMRGRKECMRREDWRDQLEWLQTTMKVAPKETAVMTMMITITIVVVEIPVGFIAPFNIQEIGSVICKRAPNHQLDHLVTRKM